MLSDKQEEVVVGHPNIKRIWVEWVHESGNVYGELVVETDLPVDPASPHFDTSALDDLVAAAVKHAQAQGSPSTRVRIVPVRGS